MTNPIIKEGSSLKQEVKYQAHEVSHITCIVNQDFSEKVVSYLNAIGLEVHVENGRVLREFVKPKSFGVRNSVKLRSNSSSIIRLTVPKECAEILVESIVSEGELYLPGRGSIFCQDMVEYSTEEPSLGLSRLQLFAQKSNHVYFLKDLAYVTCVLSGHESGERLARAALDLGVCVPLLTYGVGNDIRDQLGLIRVTISPDKEIIHLLLPQHDSESIIKLLAEESRLDRPERGYMYQTPVSMGLLDTRLKIGKQNHAASIDQIIAAIDNIKQSTAWRKRLDMEIVQHPDKIFLPTNNCKISIVSREDEVGDLREAWVKAGAIGAVTSHIIKINKKNGGELISDFAISEMSVAGDIKDQVIDSLLAVCERLGTNEHRIQVIGN